MKYFCKIILVFIVASCGHTKVLQKKAFSQDDLTISVPKLNENVNGPGSLGLSRDIQRVLSSKGFSFQESGARYKLEISTTKVELFCISEDELQYDIVITKSDTNEQMLALTGADCRNKISQKFADQIQVQ